MGPTGSLNKPEGLLVWFFSLLCSCWAGRKFTFLFWIADFALSFQSRHPVSAQHYFVFPPRNPYLLPGWFVRLAGFLKLCRLLEGPKIGP